MNDGNVIEVHSSPEPTPHIPAGERVGAKKRELSRNRQREKRTKYVRCSACVKHVKIKLTCLYCSRNICNRCSETAQTARNFGSFQTGLLPNPTFVPK
eukprot:1941680-Amphidinium_carterae.1